MCWPGRHSAGVAIEGAEGKANLGAGYEMAWRKHVPVFDLHEVEDIATTSNEEDLHGEVIQGDPFVE